MKTFKFIIILRFECDCDNHANGFIMQSKVCSAGPIISLPLYLNASCVACHSQFSPRIVCGFFCLLQYLSLLIVFIIGLHSENDQKPNLFHLL